MSYFRPEIEAMAGYTPGEQPQGGKFIKLNTNENPYPASASVGRAIHDAVERGLARYPDPMGTAFRMQAAQVLGVEPNWILCGNGSDDILTIVTRALVGQGQRLRLPYPSYILYRTLAELQGASSEEVPFDAEWRLPAAFSASDDQLKLVVLPNPNSPSGTLVPKQQILEIAERLTCPLLVDEAYVDFADDHCVDLVKRCERIMVSRTLSKSYALAGLRFGFLVAQPHMIEQFIKVKDSYNCDALSIAGATAALADQTWLRENRAKVVATRSRLVAAMRELGFTVPDSHANFAWCTHPSRPLRSIYERLKSNGVLVRYMNYAGWGDGLRISVGTDEQNDACLALIRSML
ncbi:MAG TPA: histidinol-phosphate transaminase [Pirellulaceae bacterium]|nr:histidinol-phosphate transaminase [Pirellulaceae bacterium]